MVLEIDKHSYTCHGIGAMLPEMAAIFFDGLTPDIDELHSQELLKIGLQSDLHARIQFLQLPPSNGASQGRTRRQSGPTAQDAVRSMYRREDQFTLLRSFVLNLSQTYNNILMGLLGHVTLINMDLSDQPDMQAPVRQMEQLIQTGANLINLIFGYLVERRLPARQLQLIQLFGEFELSAQPENRGSDIEGFRASMQQITAIHNHSKIIAAVARVLDQLLNWIKAEKVSLTKLNSARDRLSPRLAVMDALLERGFKIVQDLKYHAGDIKPAIGRMSLRVLIQQHIQGLKKDFPRIVIWGDLPRRLPWIFADRKQVDHALQKIITNAVEAMPGKGRLSIRVRPMADELPSERCAVHSGGDYVVTTIADSGKGMDINTQGRIFQPFYKQKAGTCYHPGLGLSAASGIIKAHGGFIQVRSQPGRGSIFKIYLPTERAA